MRAIAPAAVRPHRAVAAGRDLLLPGHRACSTSGSSRRSARRRRPPTPLATHTFPLASRREIVRERDRVGQQDGRGAGCDAADLVDAVVEEPQVGPVGRGRERRGGRAARDGGARLHAAQRALAELAGREPEVQGVADDADSAWRRRGVPFVERVSVCCGGEREQDEAREHGNKTAHPPKLSAPERARQGPNGQPIGRARSATLGGDAGTSHLAHRFCIAAQTCMAARLATRDSRRRVTMRCAPLPITSARYARPVTPGRPRRSERGLATRRRQGRELDHERVAGEAVPAACSAPARARPDPAATDPGSPADRQHARAWIHVDHRAVVPYKVTVLDHGSASQTRPPIRSSTLPAALALRDGPRAVSVAAIARESGAPTGTLYHRFSSRDDILAAAWLRALHRFHERWLAAERHQDPVEAGVAMARSVVAFSRDHPDDARLLIDARAAAISSTPPSRTSTTSTRRSRTASRRLALRLFHDTGDRAP